MGRVQFTECNKDSEQTLIFCDDGTIRPLANELYCVSSNVNSTWWSGYSTYTIPCSTEPDGKVPETKIWTWLDDDRAREITDNVTGNTY